MPELVTLIDQIPPAFSWLAVAAAALRLVAASVGGCLNIAKACAAVLQSCGDVVLCWRRLKAIIRERDGCAGAGEPPPRRGPPPPACRGKV